MSRIGNRNLAIPEGVTVEVNGNVVTVKGSKGELNLTTSDLVTVEVKEGMIVVTRKNETIPARQMHGTTNANIRNMIIGVSKGYSKSLEIVGVGYRFNLKGNKLVINAGYSHPVEVEIPSDLQVKVEGNNQATVSGISKERVGEFAANIRKVRKPEPYKGKGIRYAGEHIRRKEGKKAK
jgi:large subunit ribosomal protein L6